MGGLEPPASTLPKLRSNQLELHGLRAKRSRSTTLILVRTRTFSGILTATYDHLGNTDRVSNPGNALAAHLPHSALAPLTGLEPACVQLTFHQLRRLRVYRGIIYYLGSDAPEVKNYPAGVPKTHIVKSIPKVARDDKAIHIVTHGTRFLGISGSFGLCSLSLTLYFSTVLLNAA